MNILLVSPETPDTFWSFKHALRFVAKKASLPPLGLLTVASLLPRDWPLQLVDLNIERLRDEDLRRADYVFIGAMIVHQESVRAIVARCTALGIVAKGRSAEPVLASLPLGDTCNVSARAAPTPSSSMSTAAAVYVRTSVSRLLIQSPRTSWKTRPTFPSTTTGPPPLARGQRC